MLQFGPESLPESQLEDYCDIRSALRSTGEPLLTIVHARALHPPASLPYLESLVVFAIPPCSTRTTLYEYLWALGLMKRYRHIWLERELLRASNQGRSSSLHRARCSSSAYTSFTLHQGTEDVMNFCSVCLFLFRSDPRLMSRSERSKVSLWT